MATSPGHGDGPTGKAPLTRAREAVTPYLPPPVVTAMRTVDAHPILSSYTDEASMAILSSLILGFALIQIVRAASNAAFRRSTIHEDEGDDILGAVARGTSGGKGAAGGDKGLGEFGETSVLFGPSGSGKTVLFGDLCRSAGKNGASGQRFTVVSTKANVGLVPSNAGGSKPARVIDYPGHPSLSTQLPSALCDANRAVLVLDSTRPVSEASEMLFSALTNESINAAWSRSTEGKILLLVACTKSDVKGAKNWRRIKIQVRTELERLRKVRNATHASSEDGSGTLPFSASHKALDLDNLAEHGAPVSLHFLSVSSVKGDGMDQLRDFVSTGLVVENAPATSRKPRKE